MPQNETSSYPPTSRIKKFGILKVTGKAVSKDAQNREYWHEATRALDNRTLWVVAHYTDSNMCRVRCGTWNDDLYVAYWPHKIVELIENCENVIGWRPTRTDLIRVAPKADLPVKGDEDA